MVKISRPIPKGVYLREELFKKIDTLPATTWISAPAGSGKTTLLSSYISSRELDCLWYQMDQGDDDAATFFYYMGLAAHKAAPRRKRRLPLLTPEYQQAIPVFTQRFFQELYQGLKKPSLLVFDNYHDLPANSPLHALLAQALLLAPEGIRVLLISRSDPPSPYIRLKANSIMAHLSWDDLRLNLEETRGIMQLRAAAAQTPESVSYVHAITQGWAAGLVLILSALGAEESSLKMPNHVSQAEIFDYFACEVFDCLEQSSQTFFMKTALFPKMSADMAARLTGNDDAEQLLKRMSRNNYFTMTHPGPKPVFEYHRLYREFLLARARESFPPPELDTLYRHAAMLLFAENEIDQAITILKDIQDWEGMTAIIEKHAKELLSKGRYRTLEEWLESIPRHLLEDKPWLLYWKAMICLPFTPFASKPFFEQAFHMFQSGKDTQGSLLAASGIINAIAFGYENFSPLDEWLIRLEELVQETGAFPDEEIEAWVTSSIMTAMALREKNDPAAKKWAKRVFALPDTPGTTVPKAHALYHLYWYSAMKYGLPEIEEVLHEFQRLSHAPDAHPLTLITAHLVEALYYEETGRHTECLQAVNTCLEVACQTGVHILDPSAQLQAISSYINLGDWKAAREWIVQLTHEIESSPPFLRSIFHLFRARIAYMTGKLDEALEQAQTAYTFGHKIGSPYAEGLCHLVMAQIFHKLERDVEALPYLAQTHAIAQVSNNQRLLIYFYKFSAHFHFDRGEEAQGLHALRAWLINARRRGYTFFLDDPKATMWLCEKALEANIEVDYVREIIRSREALVEKPPLHIENWPWPVQVYTLGKFSLLRDGEPVQFQRKVQHKPLAMLKALIALGGHDVSEDLVADLLWPGSEGDMAHQAFETTLYRLRKLLAHPDSLQLREGRISIEPRYCWVDAWAFERLLSESEDHRQQGRQDEALCLVEKAVNLYHGVFLSGDADEPWIVPAAERLRSKFLRGVRFLAQSKEQKGEWEQAAECYEKCLEIDECVEEVYRRLMLCYMNLRRSSEALAVFHRCQRTLQALFGVEPSPETKQLGDSLLLGKRPR